MSLAKPERLPLWSERGSLQSRAASRGIHQLSLGPALKKRTRQTNRGSTKRSRALRQNCYTREPGTVTNLLNELNWIPLKARRTISRLTLFHKAIHGDGGLASLDYVMKLRRHLRNCSQKKFNDLLPNTETYKNSYFCRTVKDWNALTLSPQID